MWRKEVTGKRPYRCRACGARSWAVDSGPKFDEYEFAEASRALAPDPPNLKGTSLAATETQPELKLNDLDSLAQIPSKAR